MINPPLPPYIQTMNQPGSHRACWAGNDWSARQARSGQVYNLVLYGWKILLDGSLKKKKSCHQIVMDVDLRFWWSFKFRIILSHRMDRNITIWTNRPKPWICVNIFCFTHLGISLNKVLPVSTRSTTYRQFLSLHTVAHCSIWKRKMTYFLYKK